MKYAAGECTYCGRFTAEVVQYGRLTCPQSEAEACFALWEERANQLFQQLANDHGK